MAQITNFFLGANSGSGFQNLFSEIMDPETAFDIMILKGGPGVGKNTFMREIGRTMEQAGADVEYLWCSGDPDSLDGVVIPALRCAVCDGTSPHGTAPLGHHTKKGSICKALRRRKYYGSSTRHGTNRILLQDKLPHFSIPHNGMTKFVSLAGTAMKSICISSTLPNYYIRKVDVHLVHLLFHILHHYFIDFLGGDSMQNSTLILTEQRPSHDKSTTGAIIQQAITTWLTKELSK